MDNESKVEISAVCKLVEHLGMTVLAVNVEDKWVLAWDDVSDEAVLLQDHWSREEFEAMCSSILMDSEIMEHGNCFVSHGTWSIVYLDSETERALIKLKLNES